MVRRGPVGLGQKQKYVINQALAREEMPEKQQKAWLERSAQWSDMIVNPYVGKRLLGSGSHGIVGVWEYKGIPPPQMPKLIVVKQVSDIAAGGNSFSEPLRVESVAMGWINGTNTEHVVKLYRMYFETGGSGAHGIKDGLPVITPAGTIGPNSKIARIYMEYCRGGTVHSQLSAVVDQGDIIPEEYVWRFLHCMASALVVLRHGNENSDHAGPSWATPIAHFDIKPENILIGEHSCSHPKMPVYKLADFGLSLPLPPEVLSQAAWDGWPAASQHHWTNDALWRCTDCYSSPEQVYANLGHMIGNRSDVWAIGVILYELMTGKVFQNIVAVPSGLQCRQRTFQCTSFNQAGQTPFETFGRDIINRPYSARLINLTHSCLAMDWTRRPTARQLLQDAETTVRDVYTPPRPKKKPKAHLHQRIADAYRYNHPSLVRLTRAQINTVPQVANRHTIKPLSAIVPFWPVPQQGSVPGLPPFAVGQPLDPQAWPWVIAVPGLLQAPREHALRSVAKAAEKYTTWESGE